MTTRSLLIASAVLEFGAAAGLLIAPSLVASVMIGEALDSPASFVVGRIGGAALLAIALGCWRGSKTVNRDVVIVLLVGLLAYNSAVPVLLVHAAVVSGLHGIGLWPTVVVHSLLAAACVRGLTGSASSSSEAAP